MVQQNALFYDIQIISPEPHEWSHDKWSHGEWFRDNGPMMNGPG